MFSKKIGIDLGTANCLLYLEGQGVVLNEPTVVAVSADDGKILAVGNAAKEMLGRTPEGIEASRPLRDGVIADYLVTEAMLRSFLDKVAGRSRLFKPEVMVCVPAGITSVERRAVLDATISAGAKTAYLIDEPLAAAIGAKIPIAAPSGNMIVDIGGGSTDAAVISLGGVVVHKSARVAGNKIDEAITLYVRRKFNLVIGERTSEEIKLNLANSTPGQKEESLEVRGRDSITGLPKLIELKSSQVYEAILPTINQILEAVKQVLEETPPELASDIIDKGIVMSGGTSILKNLDKYFTQSLGVPCHVAEEPLFCVVYGTGMVLENIDLYKRSVIKR
ncbi:MAG: rod shape-determining protein [Candidatus Woykebacteria bacterium RIFCSPLOWO2_01_FULL_41_12]|uniref:Cell shape-determining protein MreB n=1 Tax=Candidatus Woykebacteria bacterium RIFCSPLOWO2_01_FULL_41_12 TaxID=1802604 RepID=A0A1G1WVC3_9BACT|nr:MAG: rod shape-determining protein [Candidatus Woykebacteria bacterium RIFCSPLOWO2_01_FULL_41_12]